MAAEHDLLQELRALGSEQTRKIYQRHGVGEHTYGVSYANLEALRKRIKQNQLLAEQLWFSDVHEGQVLATMIADPRQMDEQTIASWSGQLGNHVIADAFAKLVGRTAHAVEFAERWIRSGHEPTARAGWHLLAELALRDQALPDAFFEAYLQQAERDIHAAQNRVREGINNALIAIGSRSARLEALAIAAANRIGVVQIDHGETNCKTPDAVSYIRKARARLASKRAS